MNMGGQNVPALGLILKTKSSVWCIKVLICCFDDELEPPFGFLSIFMAT